MSIVRASSQHARRHPPLGRGRRAAMSVPSRKVGTLWLLLAIVSTGCATAGSAEGTAPSSDSRLITQEDLSAISVSDAYQAVERLRPLWLLAGTPMSVNQRTEVVVLQDGSYFGDVQSLRQIPAGGIREMRYMTGSEATNRFPFLASGRNVAGAILVSLGGG